MNISDVINEYGKDDSPYLGTLVNHLPMAQLALYKMIDDVERVKEFTEAYKRRANINPVKKDYEKKESLEECLGNRDLYEPCLDLVKKQIKVNGMVKVVTDILNKYPFGISSGLFHTIIRLAYSIEGSKLQEGLVDEVARALAYYVTAYRKASLFTREISEENIIEESKNLIENPHIQEILESRETRGQKIKGLYEDREYMNQGFIIKGSTGDKVKALLDLLLPIFNNTKSIVVLHCITGLHASLVLKDYYKDFPQALDILTTSILTHLLTVEEMHVDDLEMRHINEDFINMSWNEIFERVSKSLDAHVLKLAYTSSELYKLYENPLLKQGALIRL